MSSRSLANDNGRSTSYYLVKEVTDKMYRNGEPWYKVWWEGYPRSESTWEPLSNFLNYIPILEYERKLKTNNFEDDFKKYINSLSNISTRKNYQPVGDGYEHEIYFSKNRQNIINKGIPTHVVRRFNIKKKVLEPNKKHFMNNSLHDLYGILLIILLICSYFILTDFIEKSKSEETFYCPNTKCEIFKLYPYDKDICLIEKNTTNNHYKEKNKYKKEVSIKEYTYEDMLIL